MCKRNVQTGCTGYVHIAAMWMMENNGCFLQFIRLSPVDVMRLSLGAWWPEGRSSSSVSQFLPSCSWSACQMAAEWKDGYRGDLSPWLFLQLCFCSVWGRCPAERGGQTQRCAQLSARLSAELCSPDLWRYCTTLRCTLLSLGSVCWVHWGGLQRTGSLLHISSIMGIYKVNNQRKYRETDEVGSWESERMGTWNCTCTSIK